MTEKDVGVLFVKRDAPLWSDTWTASVSKVCTLRQGDVVVVLDVNVHQFLPKSSDLPYTNSVAVVDQGGLVGVINADYVEDVSRET